MVPFERIGVALIFWTLTGASACRTTTPPPAATHHGLSAHCGDCQRNAPYTAHKGHRSGRCEVCAREPESPRSLPISMEHRSFMGALAEEALRLAPGVATIMDTDLKAIGCGCRITAYEATYKLRSEGATDESSVLFRLDSDLRLISVSQQEL